MARNSEKQYGKLNRLYLQKEKEEHLQTRPVRPKLGRLNTVDEIKKWLPSIKRDIEFNLSQSQVVCYSDNKVIELQDEVTRLEKEYKSFVHKIRRLDPSITQTPWTNRPYENRSKSSSTNETDHIPEKIATPLLDDEDEDSMEEDNLMSNCNVHTLDAPLEFSNSHKTAKKKKRTFRSFDVEHENSVQRTKQKLFRAFGLDENNREDEKTFKNPLKAVKEHVKPTTGKTLLGLNYSSSEDDS